MDARVSKPHTTYFIADRDSGKVESDKHSIWVLKNILRVNYLNRQLNGSSRHGFGCNQALSPSFSEVLSCCNNMLMDISHQAGGQNFI